MPLDRAGENAHRILKARFEIAGGDHGALLDFSARLSAAAERDLPAALATVLDAAAGPDEVLEIDRVEVDLGLIDAETPDFTAMAAALAQALKAMTKTGAAPSSPFGAAGEGRGEEAAPRSAGVEAAALDALIICLLTGHLPARSPRRDLGELIALILRREEFSARAAARLRVAILSGGAGSDFPAAERLLFAAGPEMLTRLIRLIAPAFISAAGGEAACLAALRAARKGRGALGAFAALLAEGALERGGGVEAESARAGALREKAAALARMEDEEEAGLWAPNAGVILLHPFLPRFFAALGLLEGPSFRSPEDQVMAARLIHYLATGAHDAAEPDLRLARVLVAAAPDLPILPGGPLPERFVNEAEALLAAVIGHWKKLGSTSIAGLREAFLTRPGVLKGKPEQRRLLIEQRGVDMLLGALPWSLAMVVFPWMRGAIGVDWG